MDDSQALSLVKGRGDASAYQLASTSASTSAGPSNASAAAMRNVPAFLNKLFNMVNDPSTDDMIRWTEDGTSFTVPSSEKFGKEMLPRFFKHSNFGSFVRQLNMYGFHKVPHLQQGVLKHDEGEKEKAEILEFRNDYFQRDSPDLLYLIQRKKGSVAAGLPRDDSEGPADSRATGSSAIASTSKNQSLNKYQGDVSQLLNEVAAIKRHQTLLSTELRELQNSNRQLWQENLQHKARHDRNQEMIDKILKFLAGVFGGRALNEGTGFTSGNIAAADSMSGLGLNSYGQNNQNLGQGRQEDSTSGKVQEQSASPSESYAMVNIPRKRRRLLLESPDKSAAGRSGRSKAGSAQPAVSSQFEEIASDEDIPVFEELNGSAGSQSADNSPAQPSQSSFGPIHPQNQQYQAQEKPASSTLPTDDLANIDWPAMNAFFGASNADANGSNSNTSNPFDYTNPSFYNSFSNALPSQPEASSSNVPLFSPNTLANAQAIIDSQALTKYNGKGFSSGSTNPVHPTTSQEQYLKTQVDSLGAQLDKLVAQLPPDFDYNALQQPSQENGIDNNNNDNLDDFDFSQYLDNLNDATLDGGNAFDNSQDLTDPLAAYLDPALIGDSSTAEISSIPAPPTAASLGTQSIADQPSEASAKDGVAVKEESLPIEAVEPVRPAKTSGKQPMKSTSGRSQKRPPDSTSDSAAGRGRRSTRARLGT